jgi:hypothetical protein
MIFLRKHIILAALFVKGCSYLDIDSHVTILCRQKKTESVRMVRMTRQRDVRGRDKVRAEISRLLLSTEQQ